MKSNVLNAFKEEFILNLKVSISYKTNFISETIIIALLYFSLIFLNSGEYLSTFYATKVSYKSLILISYILWDFSIMAINVVSSNISGESSNGTLEQKLMSNIPISILMFSEFLSTILIQCIEILILVLLSQIFFNVGIKINLPIILIILINLIGMYGIGLIFGGISLKEKKIGKVIYIFQILLLFVCNTITSPIKSISINKIIPLTIGNDLARKSLCGIQLSINNYLELISVSLIWLVIGILTFNYFKKLSKKEGLLNTY